MSSIEALGLTTNTLRAAVKLERDCSAVSALLPGPYSECRFKAESDLQRILDHKLRAIAALGPGYPIAWAARAVCLLLARIEVQWYRPSAIPRNQLRRLTRRVAEQLYFLAATQGPEGLADRRSGLQDALRQEGREDFAREVEASLERSFHIMIEMYGLTSCLNPPDMAPAGSPSPSVVTFRGSVRLERTLFECQPGNSANLVLLVQDMAIDLIRGAGLKGADAGTLRTLVFRLCFLHTAFGGGIGGCGRWLEEVEIELIRAGPWPTHVHAAVLARIGAIWAQAELQFARAARDWKARERLKAAIEERVRLEFEAW